MWLGAGYSGLGKGALERLVERIDFFLLKTTPNQAAYSIKQGFAGELLLADILRPPSVKEAV